MNRLLARWVALGALALGAAAGSVCAQDVLPIPPASAQVIDQTGTLSEPQRAALIGKLAALEQKTGTQMVVLLVPTTAPEDVASYAQRVADNWKIGRRDVGDGLVIIVAKDDRRVRIEVAKTLEGAIPDLAAKRIISEQISPAFKAGDYAGGLNAAVDKLAARVQGESLPEPKANGSGGGLGVQWQELAMFFFIGVPVLGAVLTGIFGRKLGSLVTGGAAGGIGWWLTASALLAGAAGVVALVLVGILGIGAARGGRGGLGSRGSGGMIPPIIWGGGSGGGWGGGGSGGGGFSSGGGGDFGGGGASGDW